MRNKTVSNTTPKSILDACAQSGVDVQNLFSNAKIVKDIVNQPNGRTPFNDVIRLWEKSFEKTNDRMIGIKASSCVPFGAFKIIDYIFATSSTPKEGLSKFADYYPLVNEGFISSVNIKGNLGYIELHNPTDPKVLPFQYVDFVFACILTRVRFSTSINWNPIEVNLTCSEPQNTTEYNQMFQAPIKFNQPVNQMIIEKDLFDLLQPNADAHLCEMLDNHAQYLLKQMPTEKDLLYELSRILRESLRYGEIDLNSSARKLGMSRRSLQRKLKTQGVSYRKLLKQIRYELAMNLLTQENTSIEETAFLLGYSEKSSFYRAFKEWTGKTPHKFLNH